MSTTSPAAVHVRPRAGLLGTAVLTLLLVSAPLFGVLYWLSAAVGTWPEVVIAHAIVVVVCLLIGLRQLTVFTEVRDGIMRGNGIFSPVEQCELRRVARVDIVDTYVGVMPDPVRQLLVRDAEGRRLYRMRGNYWHRGDLERIAAALPVPAESVTEPLDLRDFFRRYPGSAYWFENRRAITALAIGLSIVGMAALALAAMLVVGQPIAV